MKKEKIMLGLIGLLICVCLISVCYASENNDSNINDNQSESSSSFDSTNDFKQPTKTNNRILSSFPKIIIKDGKEYVNTTHGQYPVKYTDKGMKYYQIDREYYFYEKYRIHEFVDENGDEYAIDNGTKYLIHYDSNGSRYWEVNGEKHYFTKGTCYTKYYINEFSVDENGNEYVRLINGTECLIQYDSDGSRYCEINGSKYYITQMGEGNMSCANNFGQSAMHDVNQNYTNQNSNITSSNNEDIPLQTTNKTINQNNNVQLESTGIPIAILLIAIIGSVIGFKRKK